MNWLDIISQVWITLFGCTSLWMVNSRNKGWRFYGAVIGFCAGLGWYTQMVIHDQWVILPAHLIYSAAWIRGMVNHRKGERE